MMKLSLLTASGIALLVLGPLYCATPSQLRAGAAKVDITPNQGELAVSTDSIRDHLFARAILVEDGSTCAVLVRLDLGGVSNQVVTDATTRASNSTGCPPQNFIISATHT